MADYAGAKVVGLQPVLRNVTLESAGAVTIEVITHCRIRGPTWVLGGIARRAAYHGAEYPGALRSELNPARARWSRHLVRSRGLGY